MTEMIWPRIATDRRGCVTWSGHTVFSFVSAYICADPRLKKIFAADIHGYTRIVLYKFLRMYPRVSAQIRG